MVAQVLKIVSHARKLAVSFHCVLQGLLQGGATHILKMVPQVLKMVAHILKIVPQVLKIVVTLVSLGPRP